MLATAVARLRPRLDCRLPILGRWLRRRAVRALTAEGSRLALETLAAAAADSTDRSVRTAALAAIRELAARGNCDARTLLCRLAIRAETPAALDEVLRAGYVPNDPLQQALFYFLSEQWKKYDALDVDGCLLAAALDAEDDRLRARVAGVARAVGRTEWIDLVIGGRHGKRLGSLTTVEWRTALEILEHKARWVEMWRLAQMAPPRWSVRLLRRLSALRWYPSAADRPDFDELMRLADSWDDARFRSILQCTRLLDGDGNAVRCLAFTPDEQVLATGKSDGAIFLHGLAGACPHRRLSRQRTQINCLAVTPDGRTLASASKEGEVWLWELPEGRRRSRLQGHNQMVLAMAVTPDGAVLATGAADHSIRLWNTRYGQPLAVLEAHQGSVLALAITEDGRRLASASADGTVRLWSLPDGRLKRTMRAHRQRPREAVLCLAMSPGGDLLASGGTDRAVRLWDLPSGRQVSSLQGHRDDVACLAFDPEGAVLASGSADHTLRLWDVENYEEVEVLEGHNGGVTHLAMSPDGDILASASGDPVSRDHSIRLWSPREKHSLSALFGHDRYLTALAFSPSGRYLAAASGDGTVSLWTSELERVSAIPAQHAGLAELENIERARERLGISDSERSAWNFMAALLRRRHRHDVLIEDAPPRALEIGAFDIEIEGAP
jgi:WD40 repeat protein